MGARGEVVGLLRKHRSFAAGRRIHTVAVGYYQVRQPARPSEA